MDLIPAVSIYQGRVVVAEQNDYKDMGDAVSVVRALSKTYPKIIIIDIDAIEGSEPQLDLIQELSEEDAELWLDTGAQCADDLVHPFVAGATVVVAGTKAVRDLEAFKEMHRVSGEVVPSLEIREGKVVWGGEDAPTPDEVLASLKDFGYKRIAIADFGRRAAQSKLESELIKKAAEMGFEVFAGGGVTLADQPALEAAGAKGAVLEFRSIWHEQRA